LDAITFSMDHVIIHSRITSVGIGSSTEYI
jgi:hypothetical protein